MKRNHPNEDQVEWDEGKNRDNQRKHGISFTEAATVFSDPLSLLLPDEEHSETEQRYYLIGESFTGRLMVVIYTERDDVFRIISPRKPSREERRDYEEN